MPNRPLTTARDVFGSTGVALRDWHRGQCAARSIMPFAVDRPVMAYVNAGRWVIDCPCGSGALVDVPIAQACCLGCGAVHVAVELPVDRHPIEGVLMLRPHDRNRNWRWETVDQLRAENAMFLSVSVVRDVVMEI